MGTMILLLTQFFTFNIDLVYHDQLYNINCRVVPVNNNVVEYYLTERKLITALDCDHIFSDSFED